MHSVLTATENDAKRTVQRAQRLSSVKCAVIIENKHLRSAQVNQGMRDI